MREIRKEPDRFVKNSGSINKEFGKDRKAAYDFADEMKETAAIRGYFVFKSNFVWCFN